MSYSETTPMPAPGDERTTGLEPLAEGEGGENPQPGEGSPSEERPDESDEEEAGDTEEDAGV
jgi:hypothetical protein